MAERDSIRDHHKSFHSDREYLRRLGELALASSLNSLTKNQNVNISDRSLNYDRGSAVIELNRDSLPHQHFTQRSSLERDRSISDVTNKGQSKDHSVTTVKLRKHDSMSEKHRSATIDVILPSDVLSVPKYEDSGFSMSGNETMKRHYQSIIRKYEAMKDEHDLLRKRYGDLVGSHGTVVSKLEMAQDEHIRMRKSFEEMIQERDVAIRDRNGLQQQCTAAIRQWDKALRETNELKEQLSRVQHQRDEAMKEINQAMAVRIKATKDMARLTEERNAAVQEYSLIMSERDSVHKEIEKLQEELTELQKRTKTLEGEKKVMIEESESLKREIASALSDRDRLLKVCNDLREKYGDYVTGMTDDVTSPTSPSRYAHNFFGIKGINGDLMKTNYISAASSCSSVSTFSHHTHKFDNIDEANAEIESLRKQIERNQNDMIEVQQEVEVCKRRRDWAFNERDKIVSERESIRTLCDKLRRERDRAVSDLAEALRDSDDIKRQRNDAAKELKEFKEKLEAQKEKESRFKSQQQQQQFGTNNTSRDSAIDADLQEFEMETIDVTLKKDTNKMIFEWWGFKLNGDERGVFVAHVLKDSLADGKVKVNDWIFKINDVSITNDIKIAQNALRKTECELKITLQRRRPTRYVQTINFNVDNGQEHGLTLETGFYVSKISPGSVAAKEGNLAIGDRILYINGKSIDNTSQYDVMQMLQSSNSVVLQVMKNINASQSCPVSPTIISSNNGNNVKMPNEPSDTRVYLRERQRKMVSCCSQTEDNLPPRPPVPIGYQSLSRNSGKRSSALINANQSAVPQISSISSSTTSSSPAHDTIHSAPSPTLLDRAYNKIFGDRKQSSKQKQTVCEDENKTIAELDRVLDNYSNVKSAGGKMGKSGKYKKNNNGGTWPKYQRLHKAQIMQGYGDVNAVMTLHPPKRKERKSLGVFNFASKSEKVMVPLANNSNPPVAVNVPENKDKHITQSHFLTFEIASEADYHSKRNPSLSPSSNIPINPKIMSNVYDKVSSPIYSAATAAAFHSVKGNKTLDPKIYRPNKGSNDPSIDYSVVSAQSKDKDVFEIYKNRAGVKHQRPHSVHDVLSEPSNAITLAPESMIYESFRHVPPTSVTSNVPIPPIRNSGTYSGYYALSNIHQRNLTQPSIHQHFPSVTHPAARANPPLPNRQFSASPHTIVSPYISRSGDSLLSGNEQQLHGTDPTHARTASSYQGNRHLVNNRYSITPSPSPSQYSSLFGGTSPSHSMDIVPSIGGPNFSTKRLMGSQNSSHLHHSSIISNASGYRSDENNYPLAPIDGLSTFPIRSQRIRIPSNPSVTSKSSGGKLSTSSIDNTSSILSDRSSPMPYAFHVEWLTPPKGTGADRKPKPGDIRSIFIEKSAEPLGIQISCDNTGSGGVFVSCIYENSLASQAGLMIGDQLLEVCGINMRNATYKLAAKVLGQCGDSIRMLVQYNPDKCKEMEEDSSNDDDDAEDADMEDEDEDDTPGNDSTSTSTPQSSPIEHPNKTIATRIVTNDDENIPSSTTSTLTRSKAASRSASNASRTTEKTITNSINERQSVNSNMLLEPRRIILKKTTSNLGISLLGGNAVGIFIHSVHDDSPALGPSGLKPGDQIIEYNGVNLRNATAEDAAYELAKPADTVTLVAQYNMERYLEIQEQPGDSFYIRAAFDRPSIDGSLAFRKDDILFVDNTMFNGVPGLWRAWLVDQDGQKVKCGVVPSKYKVEEELLMRRSLSDGNGENGERRGSASARRSFFRRRKNNHQRSSSRESTKELASFSDVSINSFSDSGNLAGETIDQIVPSTYVRVERLTYANARPVIIIGPLMDVVFEKLEQDFPQTFQRCIPEVVRGSQQMMERCLQELKFVDYRRRGSHFECTTIAAVREICDKSLHALLDVSPISVDRLNRCQIYPIIVFLKFKSTKQIKEVKDHRYPNEKVSSKAAKEMYEHSLKIESEYKDLINVTIPGSNLAYMCTQVKTCVDEEQSKALWVQL